MISTHALHEVERVPFDLSLFGRGLSPGVATAHENDVRRRYILVRYDPCPPVLFALLRVEGSEPPETRGKLRALGFLPNSSPAHFAISWRLDLREHDLASACAQIVETFGNEVLLDLGASFDDRAERFAALPTFWPGRFLLNVGGTRRCVLFDSSSTEEERARAFRVERDDYFANELIPATE